MQKSSYPKTKTQDNGSSLETSLFSIINPKPCPCSNLNESDLSLSGEETSHIFIHRPQKLFTSDKNNLEFDLSSIENSPTKQISQNLGELKNQILNLTKKFSVHQQDVRDLTGENVMLKSKIIKLQENLIKICELNAQNRSKCSCSVF